MSGTGARIIGISGSILADPGDLRRAAALIDRAASAIEVSVSDFFGRWPTSGSAAGVAFGDPALAASAAGLSLPPLRNLSGDVAAIAAHLRRAAEQYDHVELDLFGLGAWDIAQGAWSTYWSFQRWQLFGGDGPQIDPRLAGLADFGLLVGSIVQQRAIASERTVPVRVRFQGTDRAPDAASAPRTFADLARNLVDRAEDGGGCIDVQIVADPQGNRRVIVTLPGTTNWNLFGGGPVVTDVDGNLAAIEGEPSAYSRGVIEALRLAGVSSREPILFVGHSQGGLVAANLTKELAATGEFTVTDLVTFGAPFARNSVIPVARGVQTIAFQNKADPVPLLDDRDNPEYAGIVTVEFANDASLLDAHGMESGYVSGAEAFDADSSPAAQAAAARVADFLNGTSVVTNHYEIRRAT